MSVNSIVWDRETHPSRHAAAGGAEADALRELGIPQLLFSRRELSDEEILGFLNCKGGDIVLRQGVLEEALQKEELSSIFDALLQSISKIKRYLKEYSIKDQEKIVCFQALYLLLREYVQIIGQSRERLESAGVKSRGLTRLLHLFKELWDSQNLNALQESLSHIGEYWNPPKICEFGLNIDSGFHIKEITVTKLFPQREFAESTCFSRPTYLHRGTSTAKLQYYYFKKLKSLLNTELGRLQRDLKPFSPELVSALLQLEREFTLYSAGIRWCQKIKRKNAVFCFPAVSQHTIRCRGMALPETVEALETADRYTVDLKDGEAVCIVTGAGSAYKDGFAAALGANQVLFQLGFPVCASEAALPVREHVFTIFAQGESEDESRFAREARLTAQIEQCGGESLVLLRDAYTSTNAREGEKIAAELIEAVTKTGSIVVCSTHFAKLVSALADKNIPCASYVAASGTQEDGCIGNMLLRGEPYALSYARQLAQKHSFTVEAILEILKSKDMSAETSARLLRELALAEEGGAL